MSTLPTPGEVPGAGAGRQLPPNPSLDHLRKMAKRLLAGYRSAEPGALAAFKHHWARQGEPGLQDAQCVVAREHGFASWVRLKRHIEAVKRPADFDDRVWGAGTWAFFTACLEGRQADVDAMLAQRPWLARASYAYYEPLHYAVRGGHSGVVQSLLMAGGDPLAGGWQRRLGEDTPLAWAKDRGQTDIVGLLENPPRPPRPKPDEDGSWKSGDPLTPTEKEIQAAAHKGDYDRALELLTSHPGIAQAGFYEAVHHGHERVVRLLIEHGADPRKPGPWACWFTPLMHCLRYDEPRYAIAELLLDHGISPDERNGLGMAALHLLMVAGPPAAARWLLDRGAKVDLLDFQFSSTPLGWAARWGRLDMAPLLLEHGADVAEPADEPWAQPLAWAMRRGHGEMAKLLRERRGA